MESTQIKPNYDSIDLFKVLLSVLIIQIHSDFYATWMKPYVRLAVPLFFIISAFFFFKKNPGTSQLVKYVKRLSLLYASWFIVWGVYFLYSNREQAFTGGGSGFCVFMLRSIFLGSTFAASWYIAASIIGTVIVFYLSKALNDIWLIGITFATYIVVTLSTTYHHLFPESFGIIDDWYNQFSSTHLSVSFPVSLFWIALGKALAGRQKGYNKTSVFALASVASLILLQLEYQFAKNYYLMDDCFFLLIPSCLFLFLSVYSINGLQIPYAKQLRSISTIVYCSHYSIIMIAGLLLFTFTGGTMTAFQKFFIAIMGSGILSAIILKLENKRYFTWLKYSH